MSAETVNTINAYCLAQLFYIAPCMSNTSMYMYQYIRLIVFTLQLHIYLFTSIPVVFPCMHVAASYTHTIASTGYMHA